MNFDDIDDDLHADIGVGIDRRRHYASTRGPFQETAGLLTFYGGGGRGAILDDIAAVGLTTSRAMHVHGEPGSGRTFLSLVLADRLAGTHNVIHHESERPVSVALLLRHLLIELCPSESALIGPAVEVAGECPSVDDASIALATGHVLTQLRHAPPGGKPCALIVDAVGRPDAALLALLDQLAGVRRGGRSAMQVVLFRSADAEAMREAGLRDDDGRASDGHYWLRRLTLAEVGEYLRHRMMLFDFSRRALFSREMSYFVADRTEGLFGPIDTLARHAFTLASLEDERSPSMVHLLTAARPPRAERPIERRFLARHRRAFVALLACGVVGSTAALVLLFV